MIEQISSIIEAMGTAGIVVMVIGLALFIFVIAAMWKIYAKAGQPGWAVLIPIYNNYIMTKIIGKPAWWTLLLSIGWLAYLVPDLGSVINIVSLVFTIWAWNLLVHKFGKGTGYTVGVILLGIVFIPMLGFGDAQYIGDGDVDVDAFGSKTPDVNLES